MTYAEYKGFKKTYVVVYVTGTGVMEDNFIDHDVVFESNDKGEADEKAKELTMKNNSIAEIESTWYRNRYQVNINTLSKKGKELLKKFENDFDEKLKNMDESKYNKIENNG
jgi:predicted transcriptional regulator